MKEEKVKKLVRNRYAKVAKTNGSCCASSISCSSAPTNEQVSKMIGYSEEEMDAVPEGANLGKKARKFWIWVQVQALIAF